ncbi:Zn-ribbon domain-containing OB-fold protein [Sandarakinorhabdus sp. DWP1-3-1]|uniref:Zn-ribbon domain-containing OB-fold protein n=1 Tax=Sandarakinorhabdus sp. DWP1-3-1 TaxID=2804627 RepID=UPI003CF59111
MTVQVADNLFTGEGEATRLLAGRRHGDGKLLFPFPSGPEAENYALVELAPEGTLWSWTVQRFRPKSPYDGRGGEHDFLPYAVGYIELPGELIVESRIVVDRFESLKIGLPMRITTEAYTENAAGEPVLTYAFTPKGSVA